MFTGIVETTRPIVDIRETPEGYRLCVDLGDIAHHVTHGASIALDGICLTAATIQPPNVWFDVIPETWRKTALSDKRPGDRLNVERSLAVGDRLDGHFVQGHVDGTAVVTSVHTTDKEWLLTVEPQPHLLPYMVPKGSITIAGVSLTLAQVQGPACTVAIIPTTLQKTNLGQLQPGNRVNIESDMLVRAIVHYMQHLPLPGQQPAPPSVAS